MSRIAPMITAATLLLAPLNGRPLSAQRTSAETRRIAQQAVSPAVDSLALAGLRYRMVGPWRGGRSTAVTGIAGESSTFLMGSTGGGIWKTDDAGQHWANISDGFFGGSIGAIDVADSDPNVIYVGTGSACVRGNASTGRGAWRSTDGGRNWSFIGLPETGAIGDIAIHPSNPDLVYIAALGHPFGKNRERGVFRSKDGGRTWEHVLFLNDSTGVVDLALDPKNPRILYAAAWRAERKPWGMISGGPEGGVYKSTDAGDTWKKLEGGLPTGVVGKVGVTVSPANPDRVWALIEAEPDGGVYRSDDAGKTWTRTNSTNDLRQRAWYYTHIEADPQDENTVYALNTSFYRSVDGGKTFDNIATPHGDMHDVWINPDDPTILIVADDGGAQVSLNNGRTFSSYYNQPTAELYGVVVDNQFPYRLYGAQQDNTGISVPAWMSANTIYAKQHWVYPSACETGPIALHPDHPEIVWGGCYGGAINRLDRTTDQRRNVVAWPQLQLGQAAKDLKYRFQWVSPIVVSRFDPNTVYHAAQKVLRTRDAGASWEEISPDLTTNDPAFQDYSGGPINHDVTGVEIFPTIFSLVESPDDARTLWAGSDDGRLHITRDAGGTWTDVTPPGMPKTGTVNRIEVSTHSAGRAFIAVQRYRLDDWKPYIFRTSDYGRTWTQLADGTNGIPANDPVRVVREDPDRRGLLYAGTEFGLFVSFDDGQHWQPMQLNLPVSPVTDIAVHDKDLAISTQGRSFWILDDISPLHQYADSVLARPFHLFSPRDAVRADMSGVQDEFAPEPHPQGATIYYHLADSTATGSPILLEILDEQGRRVKAFSSDSAKADSLRTPKLNAKRGTNRMTWDLMYDGPKVPKNVVVWGYTGGVKAPPGTYQARFSIAGESQVRSFRVLADPRLDVPQADYVTQFRLAVQVRDSLNSAWSSVETLRDVRSQVEAVVAKAKEMGVAGELAVMADSIRGRLGGVEDDVTQKRSESGQDPIRFPGRIDNQLVELYGNITGTDGYINGGPEGQPSRAAVQRTQEMNGQWLGVHQRLIRILEVDIAAFNALARRLGIPPVAIRPRPVT
jgi:photosystem II stability/assembly factor-like uncharacterized protein